MSYLRNFCLFAYGGIQSILCCVFALFAFVLCTISLDCPFFVALSVFSNVYLSGANKGNNKITELRTILQRENQNS
jgi:membrane glycosyltransferase